MKEYFSETDCAAIMAQPKQANGHASRGRRMSEVVMQLDERMQKEENIFLFMPNLIGRLPA